MPISRERKKMRRHARKRAREHHGLTAKMLRLGEIARTINEGRAKFIRQDAKRVKLFEVRYFPEADRAVMLTVVYDTKRKEVITFKPPA